MDCSPNHLFSFVGKIHVVMALLVWLRWLHLALVLKVDALIYRLYVPLAVLGLLSEVIKFLLESRGVNLRHRIHLLTILL